MSKASSEAVVVSQSYAQALFNTAKSQGVVQGIIDEAYQLGEIAEKNAHFLVFLEGPHIPTENKRDLLDKVFKGKLNPLLENLLYMLIDRERAELLEDILTRFRDTAEREQGIYPATVYSAREIGVEDKLSLKTALEQYTGCQLRLQYQIRPHLLGGVVFHFKDTLVDGSVRHGLDEIRERFLGPAHGVA